MRFKEFVDYIEKAVEQQKDVTPFMTDEEVNLNTLALIQLEDILEKAKAVEFDDSDLNVVLSQEEYNKMKARLDFLDCLEAVGVDNWDGYYDAVKMIGDSEE